MKNTNLALADEDRRCVDVIIDAGLATTQAGAIRVALSLLRLTIESGSLRSVISTEAVQKVITR